jgi:hypothetical protein
LSLVCETKKLSWAGTGDTNAWTMNDNEEEGHAIRIGITNKEVDRDVAVNRTFLESDPVFFDTYPSIAS